MDADRSRLLKLIQLNLVSGIGPRMRQALLEYFGSVERILSAAESDLRKVPGIGPKLARAIVHDSDLAAAERELEECEQNSIRILTQDSLPKLLTEIHDPPTSLFCRGELLPRDDLSIGIVGSRRCTAYGRRMADRLASSLARAGMTIVSGLARGIDGIAHRAALEANGRTAAVLGSGVLSVYPPEHRELADEIVSQNAGAVLSEFSLQQRPTPGLFPQRNRIISGMSCGVIIVEATRTSGSLYTARHAMEQGRLVFAVPGQATSIASEGCLELIRDGAILVRHADDVLSELGPLPEPTTASDSGSDDKPDVIHSPRELSLNEREREILNLVPADPTHVDEILRSSDIQSNIVLSTLTILEMKRMLRRMPGGYWVRSPE